MGGFPKSICVFLFAGACLAADIGDFAPLQVGNTWLYQGFRKGETTTPIATSYRSECFRTIKVLSMGQVKDTLIYSIKVVDTSFNRIKNGIGIHDTEITYDFLVKERLGIIQPNPNMGNTDIMIADAFHSHNYLDSLVKNRLIENTNRLVVAESVYIPGFRNYTLRKSERIKDMGLHAWTWSFANTGSSFISLDTASYSLIRFNGFQVHPVGVHPNSSGKGRKSTLNRTPSRILGAIGVNALGRHMRIISK